MELADYLRVLRRRWWLVALAIVVCASGAFAASLTQTPRYTSGVQLLVGGSPSENNTQELVARQLAATRAGQYSLLLPAPPAVADVSQRVGVVGGNPVVTATADGTSPYINVSVTADSPQAAQKIAAGYGRWTAQVVSTLEQRPDTARVKISVMAQPGLPTSPVSPNPMRNLLIGAAIGLVLGLGSALGREALDARLRDSSEIEKLTGVTLLGSIPKEHSGDSLPTITRPRSGRAEAYRHVRTNLEFTSVDGMPRSIVVTSPAPGEGKSSTAANLAIVAARSGRNVVLVDADLRKPTVAKYFGIQASVGLSDVLNGRWRWQEALVPVQGENLHILASGPVPRFPSELVGSARMAAVIQELEEAFDFVVVDSPPVLPVSDALVIGVNVGGVVVVARMIETRRAALKRAVDAVAKVNATLLGVIGNAVVKHEEKAYGEGYGYAYGYTSSASEEPSAPPLVAPAERRAPESHRRGRHAGPPDGQQPAAAPVEPPGPWPAQAHPAQTYPAQTYSAQSYPAQTYAEQPGPELTVDLRGSHRAPQYGPSGQGFGMADHPQAHHPAPYPVTPPPATGSLFADAQYPPSVYPQMQVPPPPQPHFVAPTSPAAPWTDEPWGMPPQGSGPLSPPDALRLDDIMRQRPRD